MENFKFLTSFSASDASSTPDFVKHFLVLADAYNYKIKLICFNNFYAEHRNIKEDPIILDFSTNMQEFEFIYTCVRDYINGDALKQELTAEKFAFICELLIAKYNDFNNYYYTNEHIYW